MVHPPVNVVQNLLQMLIRVALFALGQLIDIATYQINFRHDIVDLKWRQGPLFWVKGLGRLENMRHLLIVDVFA